MNLIGNSCIASYITRDFLHQKFVNPFCWCIMDFQSCYNLVKYWDSIDFNNFELIKDEDWNFSIIIDDKVKVQYVHYLFDKNATKIIKNPPDVKWNRIWEYIVEKYTIRVKNIKNEPPIFLFATANNGLIRHKHFTLEQQKMLDELNSPYKIIVSFKDVLNETKNITCVKQKDNYYDNGYKISEFLYKESL